MKISIFQTILLAAFGALAVGGVLIFALVVGTNSASSLGRVTIWGTLDKSTFEEVLSELKDQDDTFSLVEYVQKSGDNFSQALTEALATDTGPDLFILTQDEALRDSNKIYVLSYDQIPESQFRNTFVESANPFLTNQGITAIPFIADPLVLYWNRDLLSSAGYANPPKYWDEIGTMATRITQRTDAGQITRSAIAFGEYRNIDNAKEIVSTLILQAGAPITERLNTGEIVPALSPNSQGAGYGQASESALRFYTEFADPSKSIYSWNRSLPNSRTAFTSGDLALYIGHASEYQQIQQTNPNLNFAVAAMPQIRSTASSRSVDYARVYGLAVSRGSRNIPGAITVASTLASSPLSKLFATGFGVASARRDVVGSNDPSQNSLFDSEAIISRAWIDPNPGATENVFRAMIENVTSGTLRLDEAVKRANQELAQTL